MFLYEDARKTKIFILSSFISTSKERQFINVKSTSKSNVETTFILSGSENSFILMPWYSKNYNLYLTLKRYPHFNVKQRYIVNVKSTTLWYWRNYNFYLTLKKYPHFNIDTMLKQRWFWVDKQKKFVLFSKASSLLVCISTSK